MPAKKMMKSKGIYKGIKKQEKKIAKKEVRKAKKMIHKRKKWTIAASAFGYHAGYSGKRGFFAGKGGLTEHLQGPVQVRQVPAANSTIFTPRYDRRAAGRNGLKVSGLQLLCNIGWDATSNAGIFMFGGAGGTRQSSFEISPDVFGGQMAFDARNYQYYRFKWIRFVLLLPSTPLGASQPDSNTRIALAHFQDPRIGSFQTLSYAALQNSNDMVNVQIVQPYGPVTWKLKQLGTTQVKWFNTEQDSASSASDRMCCQGVIYGFYPQNENHTAGVIGDLIVEYELELKDRSPDYGFSLKIGDKELLKKVYDTIEGYVDEKKKDCKDEDDEKDLNFFMPMYTATMKHMKKQLIPWQAGSGARAVVPMVIADRTYDGSDDTKLAAVASNVLACGGSGGGVTDVNVKQVGGVMTTDPQGAGNLPVTLIGMGAGINNSNIGSNGGKFCVNLQQIQGTSLTAASQLDVNVASVGANSVGGPNVPIDLKKVNGTTVPTNSVPVNVTEYNGNGMPNANYAGGAFASNVIPVQICAGNSHAPGIVSMNYAASDTTSSANIALFTHTASFDDSKTVGVQPPSPTESLDSVMVMKMPKRKFEEIVKKETASAATGLKDKKDEKDQKKKGPPGPSEYDEDIDFTYFSTLLNEYGKCDECEGEYCTLCKYSNHIAHFPECSYFYEHP